MGWDGWPTAGGQCPGFSRCWRWRGVTWIGGTLGIIPNSAAGIAAVLVIMGVAAAWLAYRQRAELADFFRRRWAVVTTTELAFLVIFAFWALVISEVPAINHTEKPMDFGILNAVANADRFPPEDQWLSGHSIAYYYGGHYVAAMLSTLTGVATDKAYNLAVATIPALLAAGILGLVYNVLRLAGARAFPALGAGLLTAVGVTMLGNLSGVLELAYVRGVGGDWFWEWVAVKGLEPPAGGDGWLPDGFWWWWRGTRVIDTLTETGTSLDYTITEVPFFSFLLGDLHAHVSALPFVTLALTLTLALLVSPFAPGLRWLRRRPGEAAALALVLGSLAFINAWDFPLYLAIAAMTAVACWSAWRINRAERRTDDSGVASSATLARATGRSALLVIGLAVAGVVLFLPFYQSFDSQAGGILPVTGPATRPFLFLVVMGRPRVPGRSAGGQISAGAGIAHHGEARTGGADGGIQRRSVFPLADRSGSAGFPASGGDHAGGRVGLASVGACGSPAGHGRAGGLLRAGAGGQPASDAVVGVRADPGGGGVLPAGRRRVVPDRGPLRQPDEHRVQGLLPGLDSAWDCRRGGHLLHCGRTLPVAAGGLPDPSIQGAGDRVGRPWRRA